MAMLVSRSLFSAVVAACLLGGGEAAYAFDTKAPKTEKSSPWAVFQRGFDAYRSGHKDEAVEAYRYAAENGQLGATWKLARMYAEGDGVSDWQRLIESTASQAGNAWLHYRTARSSHHRPPHRRSKT